MSPISRWKRLTQHTGWPLGPMLTVLLISAAFALLWAAAIIWGKP